MRVSISKAAEMVGITRATLYRHIDKKGITVMKDDDGNPKIDVSELIRVYGDKVREIPDKSANTNLDTRFDQSSRPALGTNEVSQRPTPSSQTQVEIEVLRERVRRYEAEKSTSEGERERERKQLMEQIEHLQTTLSQSQEQQKRLTLLLTDQRTQEPQKPAEGAKEATTTSETPIQEADKDDASTKQLDVLEKTIQKLQNQNKRIYFELQKQKEQGFLQRLFGN